uniref:Photosystem II protein T n=3 Tax=Selaginella TaxID=3246 RepID=A0A482CF57_9TRAC|nr:photosystem II protein T [Selaginella uncinata]YP_009589397.1 photosystem II protein T [Selaginella bisulcata]YP_009589538.1 photosystem II protein T [Selaginella hainanensis]QBL07894.1 photosystem II protein T [Selaginella uncinata]QBL75980.1 photosystem II protein T [Selaginella bisulcata]QBL76119.1 photosystem II protein T [Selaginella hainanensis]
MEASVHTSLPVSTLGIIPLAISLRDPPRIQSGK